MCDRGFREVKLLPLRNVGFRGTEQGSKALAFAMD